MNKNKLVKFSSAARRGLVLSVLAVGAGALIYRVFDLQIWSDQPLRERGEKQYVRYEKTPAYRGMIVDRNGVPLAVSKRIESLRVQPVRLLAELEAKRESRPQVIAGLANLAVTGGQALVERLRAAVAEQQAAITQGRLERSFPITLWQGANPDLKASLRRLRLDNAWTEVAFWRHYPDGEIASHLLGLTDKQQNGLSGVESSYNRWLSGTPGSSRTIRDKQHRPVSALSESVAPQPGRKLRLSIDRRLQFLLYKSLRAAMTTARAAAAYGVMIDTQSGEVLALVNQPGADPNDYATRDPRLFRNRAAVDLFEPGSTVKPFTVAAALHNGVITRRDIIDTKPGLIKVGRYRVRDVHFHGKLDLTGVLVKSSNVGIIKVAERLQHDQLWQVFNDIGFGRRTQLALVGEMRGRLSDHTEWTPISHATQSYGYGMSVTALQLAQAYGVLAAEGLARPLRLQRLSGALPGARRVMPARIARQVLAMLEQAVQKGGTGQRAAVTGYRVAGKTGTVKKPHPNGGYYNRRYTSLFAGIVPVSKPRLAMVVVIDDPRGKHYYGGVIAAPVFSEVMRQALPLLGIPPDGLVPGGLQLASRTSVALKQ